MFTGGVLEFPINLRHPLAHLTAGRTEIGAAVQRQKYCGNATPQPSDLEGRIDSVALGSKGVHVVSIMLSAVERALHVTRYGVRHISFAGTTAARSIVTPALARVY